MTLAEIKDKKLTCVVHTKSKTEAMILTKYMSQKNWRINPLDYWDWYAEETGYYIEDGQLLQYSSVSFYKDKYPRFGEIYELSELSGHFNAFSNDGISAKNGGKNSMKFTFYVTEGTRVDKSCNGTIPTMTTMVSYIDKYGCIMKGTATCDKTDYDERQGVLEAFANATCGNDFYKAYAEAVKEKKHRDIADRTCTYCGKVCDTIEDKNEHEAWHVECRKARHERYLLRKRAKEIAFEEQAQKMAKEMMGEQK